ncbi:chaperonin 10-like protein [Penicillium capsulatum]|uniref:Chaperonin 10-like protein n=1 Tax=Penicillium capsulatum TaxID=69766 RepID=A0A9W9I2B1_9EURO|nr:chaperonin 10-like protein [Penicillium capsulatum]KAJ6117462.1 chaperonin 10-like protein [Penicillium capsulatum]
MVQKSVLVVAPFQAGLVPNHPVPALRDDDILVQTVAVALNPTDWKNADTMATGGVLLGCDYAGIVMEVGPAVKKAFRKGDRVCGMAHGANVVRPETGAFAEQIVVKGDVQIHMPSHLSFDEAATLGVGVVTVGLGLYQHLQLPWPTQPLSTPIPILIYGGSTATGTLAIQYAKRSGYMVYTTCSPHNFDLVTRRGADAVFDYRDPGAAAEIRRRTQNRLAVAFDTISLESSATFCDQALSTDGGQYCAVLSRAVARKNVRSSSVGAFTIFGDSFRYGDTYFPACQEDRAFAEGFLAMTESLLAEGSLLAHPVEVGSNGLRGVLDGLKRMREGRVSGRKLVYRINETPEQTRSSLERL